MSQNETVNEVLARFVGEFTVLLIVDKEIAKICRTDKIVDYNNLEDEYGDFPVGYWQYFCNTKTLRIEISLI